MQFNNSTFEGRIVKQSGVTKFADDRAVCNFTIVHDFTEEEQIFLVCSFFASPKRAEFLGGLKPGNPIIVTGKQSQETYNDKKQFKLNVFDFSLPNSNKKNGNGNSNGSTPNQDKISEDENSATISPEPPSITNTEDVPF